MENTSNRDISRAEVEAAIEEWIIGKDAERNRNVIRRRLIDGITFERLAEEFELSVRRVKTIVYNGQKIVFRHIHG